MAKVTERVEEEDIHLVRMKFRELWDKGASKNISGYMRCRSHGARRWMISNVSAAIYGSGTKIKDAII